MTLTRTSGIVMMVAFVVAIATPTAVWSQSSTNQRDPWDMPGTLSHQFRLSLTPINPEPANSGPNITETTEWLNSEFLRYRTVLIGNAVDCRVEKLAGCNSWRWTDDIKFSGCNLNITFSEQGSKDWSLELKDVDPLSLKDDTALLHLGNDSYTSYSRINLSPNKARGDLPNIIFLIRDPSIGPRVDAALKHSVQLCGGKVDPF